MEGFVVRDDGVGRRVLAGEELGGEELDALVERVCAGGAGVKWRKDGRILLSTGMKSLDEVFEGGFGGGQVVGIGSEAGAGGSEICQALVVEALLRDGESVAAVVDTTGNFDVVRLYTRIVGCLQRDPKRTERLRESMRVEDSGTAVEDVAAKVLDRVKIMRVFDFEGVREAVGEIRDELEGRGVVVTKNEEEEPKAESEDDALPDAAPAVQAPQKRTYVADSEDEEDEEMLFDSESPAREPTPPPPSPKSTPKIPSRDPTDITQSDRHEYSPHQRTALILIDNLTQVLNPLLKSDSTSATALSTPFLRSLAHLTRTHALHTILFNPTTSLRPSSPTRQPGPAPLQHQPQQRVVVPTPSPSIFASCTAVPSLIGVVGRWVDVDVLVTRVPRRKIDARVYYSEEGGVGKKKRGVEMVSVVEVVRDRWMGRVGRWCVVDVGEMA